MDLRGFIKNFSKMSIAQSKQAQIRNEINKTREYPQNSRKSAFYYPKAEQFLYNLIATFELFGQLYKSTEFYG
jgi:phage regulator Rha-like protein